MTQAAGNHTFFDLREKFKVFSYEKFTWEIKGEKLEFNFHFHMGGLYDFYPAYVIPLKKWSVDHLSEAFLDSLIFHIGMVEMISYWKTACCPVIHVKPYRLNKRQQQWWKKLFFHGLGEFFYENKIAVTQDDILSFTFERYTPVVPRDFELPYSDGVIIPVGGGKDSVVTLAALGHDNPEAIALTLNPRQAITECVRLAGLESRCFEVHRSLDPLLLKLNEQGFLNGHTPFSALLAFVSLLAAAITGKTSIALSNESSANEATVPGTHVNHQYSKSVEFENDFRYYVSRFITSRINYFSFLRPLNELQIAALFARQERYFEVFRSCNVGSKENKWCGHCPKCLFTYIMLSPFLPIPTMMKIFEHNLLRDETLKGLMKQLAGLAHEKPFECVGTIDEVNTALSHLSKDAPNLPVLLKAYRKQTAGIKFTSLSDQLKYWDEIHNLHGPLEKALRKELSKLENPKHIRI